MNRASQLQALERHDAITQNHLLIISIIDRQTIHFRQKRLRLLSIATIERIEPLSYDWMLLRNLFCARVTTPPHPLRLDFRQ
ncbi:hypothetical protein D3C84_1068890 [compost metagenome]